YLSAEEIRTRIEALAPAGTAIEQVEVLDGKVHIRYDAPKGEEDLLLGRIAAAGDGARGPKEVVHGVRSTDMSRRFVRLVLTDSPLVLRERAVVSTPVASAAALSIASASTAAQSTAAPSTAAPSSAPPSMPPPILAALSEAPMQATPAGMASPEDLRKRLGALLPAGCRKIVDVRYGGERVTIVGQSNSTHCVSEALRALEGAGTRPELLQISADGSGGQRFRILLTASPLTRE
ncbi:MAG: hypothetical protein IT473_01590, partial [Lysobacter sp.]|nr:hypothetical protein [Lysobacter sp.]